MPLHYPSNYSSLMLLGLARSSQDVFVSFSLQQNHQPKEYGYQGVFTTKGHQCGQRFANLQLLSFGPPGSNCTDVGFGSNSAIGMSSSRALASSDGGITWASISTPTNGLDRVNSVSVDPQGNFWLVAVSTLYVSPCTSLFPFPAASPCSSSCSPSASSFRAASRFTQAGNSQSPVTASCSHRSGFIRNSCNWSKVLKTIEGSSLYSLAWSY